MQCRCEVNLSGHDDGLFSRNMPVSPKLADGLTMKACCVQTAVVMRADFLVMCSAECVFFYVRWRTSLRFLLQYWSAAAHCKLTVRGSRHLIAVHCALNMIRNLTEWKFSGNPITFWVIFFRRIPAPTWVPRDVSEIVDLFRCFYQRPRTCSPSVPTMILPTAWITLHVFYIGRYLFAGAYRLGELLILPYRSCFFS